jgi:hypothetical protein
MELDINFRKSNAERAIKSTEGKQASMKRKTESMET